MSKGIDRRLILNIERKMKTPSRIKRLLSRLISDIETLIADTGYIDEPCIQFVVNRFGVRTMRIHNRAMPPR